MTSRIVARAVPMALLVITLCVATASAGVITLAGSALGDGSGSDYGYNYPTLGNGVGLGTSVSCAQADTCGGMGTTDTSGTLTASFDQTSVTSANQTIGASAYAVANLASGTVGVSTSGTYLGSATGHGYALASDTLTFTVAGAGPDTVTDIGFMYTLEGTYDYSSQAGYINLASDASFGSASLQLGVSTNETYPSAPNSAVFAAPQYSGWVTAGFSSEEAGDVIFQGTYAITGPEAQVGVQFDIDEQCGPGASCDYADTGAVSLTLPAGVTFTSNSGVFLTQPENATPEPSSALLLAAALATVIARKRFRPF